MDNLPEAPEYLKLGPNEQPCRGSENTEPRDLAESLLHHLDYDAQVGAIRILLFQHRQADEELANEIKRLDERFKLRPHPGERAVDEWVDLLYSSVYQDVAHSMAAVGMLAPLVESMFYGAFFKVQEHFFPAGSLYGSHPRWNLHAKDRWNCHLFYNRKGKREKNLVEGITQLAEAVGLSSHLPNDLKPMLQALFEYRNKMFHCGFEWPVDERNRFAERIDRGIREEGWSSDWFERSTTGGTPWIFYLTNSFVDHCLNSIDRVIEGMGTFVEEQLAWRDK